MTTEENTNGSAKSNVNTKVISEADLNKFNTKYMELMQKQLGLLDMIMNVGIDLTQFARTQKTALLDTATGNKSQSQNQIESQKQ